MPIVRDKEKQEKGFGIGAHQEEYSHPAHDMEGVNKTEKDLINRYALDKARYYGRGRRLKEK